MDCSESRAKAFFGSRVHCGSAVAVLLRGGGASFCVFSVGGRLLGERLHGIHQKLGFLVLAEGELAAPE